VWAKEPQAAADWLFRYLEVGHWLKLRDVVASESASASASAPLTVHASAATATRLPVWCFDVAARRTRLQATALGSPSPLPWQSLEAPQGVGAGSGHIGVPAVEGVEVGSGDIAAPAVEETETDEDEDEEAAEVAEAEIAEAEAEAAEIAAAEAAIAEAEAAQAGVNAEEDEEERAEEEPGAGPRAAASTPKEHAQPDGSPSSGPVAEEFAAGPSQVLPQKARLATIYAATQPTEVIGSVRNAAARGLRCHVLGGFIVAGVAGADGPEARVETLVRACCGACGQTFAWGYGARDGGEVWAAKRRRQTLPCGHWIFRLEYRFGLELRDKRDREAASLKVFVSDHRGEIFGFSPERVVADLEARRQAQQLLEALLQGGADAQDEEHTMVVTRLVGPADPSGCYVVRETRLAWMEA